MCACSSSAARDLFPLVFATAGMDLRQIGALAAIYPATWGVAQLATGALSEAVATLQARGLVGPVITQNVDGLHQAAGATDVTELHGSLAKVVCLTCGDRTSRWDLDERMRVANPSFEVTSDEIRPDGDIVLNELDVDGFFMEWDDERSGGFEPLRFLPKGEKQVVLGLVTTKRGELESKDELKRRIEEASKHAPIDQLCLSPQCGFSSTIEGNAVTVERIVSGLRDHGIPHRVWDLSAILPD